jgi:hypothetical protein
MAKVITFSRVFPSYHPRKGEPTFFVEAILNNLGVEIQSDLLPSVREIVNDFCMLDGTINKAHTIRHGSRFKVGDKFSPRCWSGKPYRSKQIIIHDDIEVKKVFEISMDKEGVFSINGKEVDVTSSICDGRTVADNDGLDSDDLLNWFPVGKPFKGQIICWDEKIVY